VYDAREVGDPYGAYDAYGAYDPVAVPGSRGAPAEPEPPGPAPEPLPRIPGSRAAARHGRTHRRRTTDAASAAASDDPATSPAAPGSALRRLVPQALVVAFLAGGSSAFLVHDKAVRLSVDGGVPRTLHTFAGEVEELLAHEGVAVGAHDTVTPASGADLADGDEVVVSYGRPVLLTLDGQRRRVWTTARTVGDALRRLGVRAEGAFLSVPHSAVIARHGLALDVRTERAVTFLADGRARTIRTNVATVTEALAAAGIRLRGEDTTSVPGGSFPRDGQTVTVLRVRADEVVREETVPFRTVRTEDPGLLRGTEVVDRQGSRGVRRITYILRTVNGVEQRPRRKIRDELVRAPVAQRVRVGTKARPVSVAGADGLDWSGLAACESGGRPAAVDPSGNYGGLYQFDTGTWHALGGDGRPQDAPAEEQTDRAKRLYVRQGASPWPHCGRRLTG
jgi:resuscitation-promoting factor RpfB